MARLCSPVLAYDTVTERYFAYLGADDEKVHVLQAQETIVGDDRQVSVLDYGGAALSGPIRSSMAALNGRLYVLSAGEVDEAGAFTKVPSLYCFGP